MTEPEAREEARRLEAMLRAEQAQALLLAEIAQLLSIIARMGWGREGAVNVLLEQVRGDIAAAARKERNEHAQSE